MSRWVTAERIYGKEAIQLNARLKAVIHMQRTSEEAPIIFRPSTAENLARYTTNVIQNELHNVLKLTSLSNLIADSPCFPDTERTLRALKDTNEKAFLQVPVYEMILGSKTTPEETYEFLQKSL